jgi:cell wall-associated NlpC family hydrolase
MGGGKNYAALFTLLAGAVVVVFVILILIPMTLIMKPDMSNLASGCLSLERPTASSNAKQTPKQKVATCPNAVAASGIGGAILVEAQKWIGLPYQYGGGNESGPSVGQNSRGDGVKGFDCSGLTVWSVYKATGGKILLPRTAAQQWQDKRWIHVTYAQLQPGDLVFWPGADGTPSAPGHVGIYAGNQRFFNAPQTGDYLRFDSMAPGTHRYRTFIGGTRITAVGSG